MVGIFSQIKFRTVILMRNHFFDSSDYSPRAVETVLGSYTITILYCNGTQTVMVVLFWNGGSINQN
jgi:hypothetical protein